MRTIGIAAVIDTCLICSAFVCPDLNIPLIHTLTEGLRA
jgi:hypothetical protein